MIQGQADLEGDVIEEGFEESRVVKQESLMARTIPGRSYFGSPGQRGQALLKQVERDLAALEHGPVESV